MIHIIAIYLAVALSVPGLLNPQAGQLPQDLSGYKVAGLELKGSILFDSEKLNNLFPIKNGDPFNPKLVKQGLEQIQQLFSNFGYIDFIYTPHIDVNHEDKIVSCSFLLVPGRQYFVKEINIYGSGSDENDREIRSTLRALGLNEGTLFSPILFDKAAGSLNTLLGTKKLTLENSEFTRSPESPGTVDVIFRLQPAKH